MEMGPPEGFTDGGVTVQTIMAGIAGHMVRGGYPVSDPEFLHPLADRDDLSGDFMTQYERDPVGAVPLHDIAAANAAGMNLDQEFPGSDFRGGDLFKPDVPVTVIHGHTQGSSPYSEPGPVQTRKGLILTEPGFAGKKDVIMSP
jgi:hypothetical protein